MAKHRHSTRRAPAAARGRARGWILCGAVTALIALAALMWLYCADPFPRLEVAGYRISEEEYLRAMYQARNDVLSEYAAAGISLKDWGAETELGDPRQQTMERALEILSEYYAVSTLAVERGYLDDAGYEAMERELEELNRQRKEAIASGAVVTGLPSFTVEDYLTYRASGLRLQFCADPENPENQVTQTELQQRYEADRDALYRQPDSMELAFLLADAPAGEAEELQMLFEQARKQGDLAAAVEAEPSLQQWYHEISVDPESYAAYARSHADVLEWAEQLQTGELSEVIRRENRLCLIRCIRRTSEPYAPLEEIRSIVEQSIRESRYEALIAQRMENTQIEGDLQQLYRFTAEQLP